MAPSLMRALMELMARGYDVTITVRPRHAQPGRDPRRGWTTVSLDPTVQADARGPNNPLMGLLAEINDALLAQPTE